MPVRAAQASAAAGGPESEAQLKKIAIITHRRSDETQAALMAVVDLCRDESAEVFIPASEMGKYGIDDAPTGVTVVESLADTGAEVCFALGGDGTILRAFNQFPDMGTPVFGVNYGRVGFLSGVERSRLEEGVRAVLNGAYTVFELSLIELEAGGERHLALNDVVAHKPDGGSVIRLGFTIGGTPINSLSCDGIIVSTAAGSTAYNLAAGGPLLTLKLDAMIVNPIAPHTVCARPLVAAPGDVVVIRNESVAAASSVYVDGRSTSELEPGGEISLTLSGAKARLLQLEGADFYRKLRDKFLRPAGA